MNNYIFLLDKIKEKENRVSKEVVMLNDIATYINMYKDNYCYINLKVLDNDKHLKKFYNYLQNKKILKFIDKVYDGDIFDINFVNIEKLKSFILRKREILIILFYLYNKISHNMTIDDEEFKKILIGFEADGEISGIFTNRVDLFINNMWSEKDNEK